MAFPVCNAVNCSSPVIEEVQVTFWSETQFPHLGQACNSDGIDHRTQTDCCIAPVHFNTTY